MKLSEAIREGAKNAPQSFGAYSNAKGATCALGAAYEGLSGKRLPPSTTSGVLGWLAELLDYDLCDIHLHDPRPDSEGYVVPLNAMIFGLNDGSHWTREQIADWLETQGY